MVTRVGKFLGGLGADVTSVANVHASQNRITLGGNENPSANAHVIGTLLATTNTIVGATAVTSGHTLDVRGSANTGAITATTIGVTGALTASGLAYPTSDGTEDYVLATDGSGSLSWTEQTGGTATNPATALATDTDCGSLAGGAGADTKDAFGQAIDDALVNLDCLLYKENALGIADMGSVA